MFEVLTVSGSTVRGLELVVYVLGLLRLTALEGLECRGRLLMGQDPTSTQSRVQKGLTISQLRLPASAVCALRMSRFCRLFYLSPHGCE